MNEYQEFCFELKEEGHSFFWIFLILFFYSLGRILGIIGVNIEVLKHNE